MINSKERKSAVNGFILVVFSGASAAKGSLNAPQDASQPNFTG
jgi:hypothetical protein